MDKNGKVQQPSSPCVIYDPILSKRMWDAVILLSTDFKSRPCRYVWLKDGLGLAKSEGFLDAYQMIYALTYCYAMSVPWPMGNCATPAPIKYAKKYAELAAQLIIGTDRELEGLMTAKGINRAGLVIS